MPRSGPPDPAALVRFAASLPPPQAAKIENRTLSISTDVSIRSDLITPRLSEDLSASSPSDDSEPEEVIHYTPAGPGEPLSTARWRHTGDALTDTSPSDFAAQLAFTYLSPDSTLSSPSVGSIPSFRVGFGLRSPAMEHDVATKIEEMEDDENHSGSMMMSESPAASTPGNTPGPAGSSSPFVGPQKRPRGRPRKHPLPSPDAQSKVAKGRSKTGCVTCRRRKKKCDETRPQCTYAAPSWRSRRSLEGRFDRSRGFGDLT